MAPASTTQSDSATVEKLDVEQSPQPDKKSKRGIFSRHSKVSQYDGDESEINEKTEQVVEAPKPETKEVVPVSIKALFRCVRSFRPRRPCDQRPLPL